MEVVHGPLHYSGGFNPGERPVLIERPGIFEQIADHASHPPGGTDHQIEQLPFARLQLFSVLLHEHFGASLDVPQRLLQVMGGNIGKLLQFCVGAGEAFGLS